MSCGTQVHALCCCSISFTGTITLFGRPFQVASTIVIADHVLRALQPQRTEVALTRFRPVPRSLAATRSISIDFSSFRVLRCFTSPEFAPMHPYVFSAWSLNWLIASQVSPFGNLWIKALFVNSPKLIADRPRPSSPTRCQGIHRTRPYLA